MAELVFSRLPLDPPIHVNGGFGQMYRNRSGELYAHRGVDFRAGMRTPVFAPADGLVHRVVLDRSHSFGSHVVLAHPGTPWFSVYAHLEQADVAEGATVAAGELLGLSGNTGESSGPHLHWQVARHYPTSRDIRHSANPYDFYKPEIPMTEAERQLLNDLLAATFGDVHWMRARLNRIDAGVMKPLEHAHNDLMRVVEGTPGPDALASLIEATRRVLERLEAMAQGQGKSLSDALADEEDEGRGGPVD